MSAPATIPLTWNGFVAQIANMAVVQTQTVNGVLQGVDPEFNTLLPQACQTAELRIQRDTDLLPLLTNNSGYSLTQGNNLVAIDVSDFVTIQTVSVVNGTSTIPLLPVSKEVLQSVWNDSSFTDQPTMFAMIGGDSATAGQTTNNIMVGPYPDQNYLLSIFGTIRMPSLYLNATPSLAGSATTFISTWLPDLLIQASLIFVAQYQRNFGAAANDPAMGPTYELQYQNLLKGALVEEARKRMAASGWSAMSPPTIATPGR